MGRLYPGKICSASTCVIFVASIGILGTRVPPAFADRFDEYVRTGSFEVPAGTDALDVFPDGRTIVLVDADVYIESGAGTRLFTFHGTLPDAGSLQFPAFLRVSPDGTRIAVGDNGFPGRVGVFSLSALLGTWFAASHFDAEWYDDTMLAISGADGNGVTLLDTTSADPLNPINPLIIDNTGIPGGITFDASGNLYTGNGFGDGPVFTGEVRVFAADAWTAVPGGAEPLDFLNDGILVVDILSAASLGFDAEGNLHVGGGDFAGGTEIGFTALVRASAVTAAIAGQGPADPADEEEVRRLDPDPEDDSEFYSITYNPVAGELYVLNFGATAVHTFAASLAVPAVSRWGVWTASVILVGVAGVVLRRGKDSASPNRSGAAHGGMVGPVGCSTCVEPRGLKPAARVTARGTSVCGGNRRERTYGRYHPGVSVGWWLLVAAAAFADPWADRVIEADATLSGSGLYNDPQSVLGMPATTYYDPFTAQQFVVSLAAAPFNLDSKGGNKLVTTLNPGQFIKVAFDEPVEDHPRNAFGIDLIVFGNSFFAGSGFLTPFTDMETHYLTGTLFAESVTVAVSPTGIGDPESNPNDWYVFDSGPFADSLFPTSAFAWDSEIADWGAAHDFALAVDPALEAEDFTGLAVAEAIQLYECSGGGTGYDLAESGFSAISYVYLTGEGGEVDALADASPVLGDLDADGDVDLRDLADFQNCFDPDRNGAGPCKCRSAEIARPVGVDLADLAVLTLFIGGPGQQARSW